MAEIDVRVEQHRNEALRLLGITLDQDTSASSGAQRNLIAAAQVHAALAHAVAQDRTRKAVDDLLAEVAGQSVPIICNDCHRRWGSTSRGTNLVP